MKAAKCVVCEKVKGKRICQLHARAFICPRCCAQIRHAGCEGCSYYAQAEDCALKKTPRPNPQHFVMRIDPQVDEEVDNALAMIERGARKSGESIIAQLLRQHPDLHTVQFAMGTVYAKQKRYDEALDHFDKAIEIFPYFVEAWFNKGAVYQEQLDIGGMIRAFQKVCELGNPKDDFVEHAQRMLDDLENQIRRDDGISLAAYLEANDRFDRAFALMEQQRWQQALEGFQAVIALHPKNTQSHGNMGLCYAYLGRKQEALAALDKALELDPSYGPALLNRRAVMAMAEGEKLPANSFGSVDYYRDVLC
jgi:tetratricopeptide (TPR) repeat protein